MNNLLAIKDNRIFYLPHSKLQPYIAHYTISKPKPPYIKNLSIIPDASGCIVINLTKDNYISYFWGPSKNIAIVNDNKDALLQFYIEFLPGGASQLLTIYQNKLSDMRLALNDIHSKIDKEIKEILLSSHHRLEHCVQRIDDLLLNYLSTSKQKNKIHSVLPLLQNNKQIKTVQELSKEVFYSERQLNRYFHNNLGMSVKNYICIQRINKAIQLFSSHKSLTEIAHICGYYDQAHFNHDFKSICQISPTKYIKQLSNFYNESYKF